MVCTHCSYPTTIVVTTEHTKNDIIKRRRECVKCGKRFNTYEHADDASKEKKRT